MTPPDMVALNRASAKIRGARAELKRKVRAGEMTAAEVVLANPAEAQGMTVAQLLASQYRWGPRRVTRFLRTFSMSEARTVGSLVERERQAVASRLTGGLRALREAQDEDAMRRWVAGRAA
jgi:DNA-binding MurR/RpiR family transcriptional regulator